MIIEQTYRWAYPLTPRRETRYLILHHTASTSATPQEIHDLHVRNGWSGIAYHYYVRKSGLIYRGRPEDTQGAHCRGYNGVSIGVCFEGNFETDVMFAQQFMAGKALITDILRRYPGIEVKGHRELNATACPGKKFPLNEYKHIQVKEDDEDMSGEEIYKKLVEYLSSQPAPDWAREELQQAIDAGITDGTNPMQLIPRYQAALMALRAGGEKK